MLREKRSMNLLFSIIGAILASLASAGAFAQAVTGKITVMTSFSKDVTDPFKKAFEAAHPGTTVEIQNRNTNAGVKLLDETNAANAVDIFWASAPDAFEVLKGKKLLQVYKPKATGIPEKIGAYPINDKDGFYSAEHAREAYGVVVDLKAETVDAAATEALRARMRA